MPAFLSQTAHRPYPPPAGGYVMYQTWEHLLFAHWPVSAAAVRAHLPPGLELDTFDGQAWLAVVPFGMRRVYPRYTVPVPGLSDFLELNVRVYVTAGGRPGVFFFSLDAANPLAVAIARAWYKLPYFTARMTAQAAPDGGWEYASDRVPAGAPPAALRARYRPAGPVYRSTRGSLEWFLTERYCLYAAAGGRVFRGEIHHVQWPLQPAEAEISFNTMAAPAGFNLEGRPALLHYVESIEVVAWALTPLA